MVRVLLPLLQKTPLTTSGVFFYNICDMDEFVVYILYSEKFMKTYTGFTSNLIERFKSHNFLETKGYTPKFRPWTHRLQICAIVVFILER